MTTVSGDTDESRSGTSIANPTWRESPADTFVDGYMCAVDWECEIGGASGGNQVYPSIKDLKAHRKCIEGCGIVKVRVQFLEHVQVGTDR